MPFKSEAQRKFMYAKHPAIAKRWAEKYGTEIAKKKKGARGGKAKGPSKQE